MANISTSTVAYATRQTAGQLVFIASDGAVCVLWCDGTNQVLSYDDNTYASWTKATLTTGLNMFLTGHFRAGTDNIDEVTGGTANVRGNYRLLTKSGATWTVGTSNVLSGTTAIGVTAQGSPTNYIGQDAQGRHWIVVSGATNTLETCYYSAANSPTTTGWTASGAVTQTADLFTPAADQVASYLVKIYWNGTALQWHRIDNSVVSLGAWTTGATIPNLTGSPNASHAVNFRAISATQGLLTYSSGSGVYAQVYTASTNTFGAATQLSTNANDKHPVIASDGAGNAWVVWCKYAAANSFSLVYKKYNGASWGAETELVAAGTNISYPNAGFGSKTLGVAYTQGTASPYTVGWASQMFGGAKVISGVSAALEGPSPLTLYGSDDSYGAPLSNSSQMATGTGGAEIAKTNTISTGSGLYTELWSQGGNTTCVSAIPADPTGYGWAFSPGAGTFGTQNWDAHVALATTDTGITSDQTVRFFRYSGGVYTPIGTLTSAGYTAPTGRHVPTLTPTAFSSIDFADGDILVVDAWFHDTSGPSSSTTTIYVATDVAAGGVANDAQITTAFFTPAVSGINYSRDIVAISAALLQTNAQTISSVSSAVKQLNINKNITTISASVLASAVTNQRDAINLSSAVKALGLSKNISNLSLAVVALGLSRNVINISGAAQQVGIMKPLSSSSAALVSLGLSRPIINISGALLAAGLSRPVVNVSSSLLFTGVKPIASVSSAVKALNLSKNLINISGSLGQGAISRPITSVSVAVVALGVAKNLSSISSALQQFNVPRNIVNISGAMSQTIYKNITNTSGAVKQLNNYKDIVTVSGAFSQTVNKNLVNISSVVSLTVTKNLVSISGALKQTNIAKNIINISGVLGVSGAQVNITNISVALKQLNITKNINTVSFAVQQTGLSKNLVNISGVLSQTTNKNLINISSALKQTNIFRDVTNLSLAVKQVNINKNINNLSSALLQTNNKNLTNLSSAFLATCFRNITTISLALKKQNIARNLSLITAVVNDQGLHRSVTNISAVFTYPGNYMFVVVKASGDCVTVTGATDSVTAVGCAGDVVVNNID